MRQVASGGLKTGYTASGKTYPVQVDSNENGYVSVPWTDTNTTYSGLPDVYCSTSASSSAKTATSNNYVLRQYARFTVRMRYANTYQGAITLNINSTGAKPIYINYSASSSSNYTLPAGDYSVYYDGTNYCFETNGDSTIYLRDQHNKMMGASFCTFTPASTGAISILASAPTKVGTVVPTLGGWYWWVPRFRTNQVTNAMLAVKLETGTTTPQYDIGAYQDSIMRACSYHNCGTGGRERDTRTYCGNDLYNLGTSVWRNCFNRKRDSIMATVYLPT